MFDCFEKGETRADIARKLAEGGQKTRSGKPWDRWAVADLLTNPTYAGATRWSGQLQLDTHPAIVTPQQYDAVQERIRRESPTAKVTFLQRLTVT
ncbi:MAG: recombinase family protein [Thermoplasmatota archaeon]